MKPTSLTKAVESDDLILGAVLHLPEPAIMEMFALAGYDWVTLTFEHSSLSVADVEGLQRAADIHGLTTLLHVPSLSDPRLLALLHVGIGGMVLQNAQTRADAEALVALTRFPPLGHRGAHSGVRSDQFGVMDYDEFMASANKNFFTGLAIEDTTGVENAEDMLSVPGIDIVFVGLHDLSHSVGAPNDLHAQSVMDALAEVVAVARRHNLPVGLPGYQHTIAELRELGAQMVITGSEMAFFRKALTDAVVGAREEARVADKALGR
jgi:2-keto-3-deoxy-L-rhamnonate aldolase RhmA